MLQYNFNKIYSFLQRQRETERQREREREMCESPVPTQISAFVVMAFPWYKLIISGARYDRVVYLSRE